MNESVNVADPVIRSSNAVAEVDAAYAKSAKRSACGPDDRLHPDGQTWGIPVADPQLCALVNSLRPSGLTRLHADQQRFTGTCTVEPVKGYLGAPHTRCFVFQDPVGGDQVRYYKVEGRLLLFFNSATSVAMRPQRVGGRLGTPVLNLSGLAVDGIAPADEFEREHEDPILGRRLQHRYRIVTLPVNS
jgi:hypothetical protein